MKTTGLITNLMFVENILDSAEFYEKLFKVAPIELEESFCSFKLGHSFFNLLPGDSKSLISKGGSVGYWQVEELSKFIEYAQSIGAKVYRGPLYVKEIDRTICQIEDPMGNIIGIEG
jgi:predicted enzyme related to lactoylglutathione lyase